MYQELTIGERLKNMRTNRRLRLEDMAAQTGLSSTTSVRYEKDCCGRRYDEDDNIDLSSYTFRKLAELAINYDKLSREEFVTLIKILRKADIVRIKRWQRQQ